MKQKRKKKEKKKKKKLTLQSRLIFKQDKHYTNK